MALFAQLGIPLFDAAPACGDHEQQDRSAGEQNRAGTPAKGTFRPGHGEKDEKGGGEIEHGSPGQTEEQGACHGQHGEEQHQHVHHLLVPEDYIQPGSDNAALPASDPCALLQQKPQADGNGHFHVYSEMIAVDIGAERMQAFSDLVDPEQQAVPGEFLGNCKDRQKSTHADDRIADGSYLFPGAIVIDDHCKNRGIGKQVEKPDPGCAGVDRDPMPACARQ